MQAISLRKKVISSFAVYGAAYVASRYGQTRQFASIRALDS